MNATNASSSLSISSHMKSIQQLHHTPRFGHANVFSNFFSPNRQLTIDYAQGIAAWGVFLTVILLTWLLLLLLLKLILPGHSVSTNKTHHGQRWWTCSQCCFPPSPVIHIGFAAGGSIIDVQYIKRNLRHLKPHLETMVKLSWRVQSVFLFGTIILPIAIFFFISKGINPLVAGLDSISRVHNDFEQLVSSASHLVNGLIKERDRLDTLHRNGAISIERHCPNDLSSIVYTNSSWNLSLPMALSDQFGSHLFDSLQSMDQLVNDTVIPLQHTFTDTLQLLKRVDSTMAMVLDHDWIPKIILLVLAIVNLFFLAGVLMTRRNFIFAPFRCMMIWFLMPTFLVLLIFIILETSLFGMLASMNADFCSGNGTTEGGGGPRETIQIIVQSQVASQSDMLYQVFNYYIHECSTQNPLSFLETFGPEIHKTAAQANNALAELVKVGIDQLSLVCGADVTPFLSGIEQIAASLDFVEDNIQQALEITNCSTITPILNDFFYGSICEETMGGLTWMFGSAMVISILGLILVTFRAGLYNATIRARKRTREEENRREFKEYKDFMADYYEDTDEWTMQGGWKDEKGQDDFRRNQILGIAPSFETGATSPSSDDASHESHDNSMYFDYDDYTFHDDETSLTHGDPDLSTPRKRHCLPASAASLAEQVKSVGKSLRQDGDAFVDEELEPLSPPPQSIVPTCQAPKKSRKNLPRTSKGDNKLWNLSHLV